MKQLDVRLHLVLLLPELFPVGENRALADARTYEFFRELEYMYERPALVTGTELAFVESTWVVGKLNEEGYDLGTYQEAAKECADFFAYVAWDLIDLQHGIAGFNQLIRNKKCNYASFGVAHLRYPTENVQIASSGRAEVDLLERRFPKIASEEEVKFPKADLYLGVKKTIRDLGLTDAGLLAELEVAPDGSRIQTNLSVPMTKPDHQVSAAEYIERFRESLQQIETSDFAEIEMNLSRKRELILEKCGQKMTETCKAFIDDASKGLPYAVSFISCMLPKPSVPYAKDEQPQDTLTIADVRENLRSQLDEVFELEPGLRKTLVSLEKKIEEKDSFLRSLNERRTQAEVSKSEDRYNEIVGQIDLVQKELDTLKQQRSQISEKLSKVNLIIDDPSERKGILEKALDGLRQNIQKTQETLIRVDKEYSDSQKACKLARDGILYSWIAALVSYLVALVACALFGLIGLLEFLSPFRVWPYLLVLLGIDFLFGTFRSYREAKKARDDKEKEKYRAMEAVRKSGEDYLDQKLRYAQLSSALSIIGEFKDHLELRLLLSLTKTIDFAKDRQRVAYEKAGAMSERDSLLEIYAIGRAELEKWFEKMAPHLNTEYEDFAKTHPASLLWTNILDGREPHWEKSIDDFSKRVFAPLISNSIQTILNKEDLASREILEIKVRKLKSRLKTFLGLEHLDQEPATLYFVGLKEAGDEELQMLLERAGLQGELFSSLEENSLSGYIVRMGIPAFAISSIRSGHRAASNMRLDDIASDTAVVRGEIYPEGYITDQSLNPDYRLWTLTKAFDAESYQVFQAHGASQNPSGLSFEEFRSNLDSAPGLREALRDAIDSTLKKSDASRRLEQFLMERTQGQSDALLDQQQEAILRQVLESIELGYKEPNPQEPSPGVRRPHRQRFEDTHG